MIKLLTLFIILIFGCVRCHIGYIAKNAYYQAQMLHNAEPINDVIAQKDFNESYKHKLELVVQAKQFGEDRLHLKKTKNYTTYVELGRPYVTYVVSASPKNELKHYTWYFPIVGSVPYKGYFNEDGAVDEANNLVKEGYDTYVRGVTAYSTLGWFKDPILSSMMSYSDYDLVNTIIHETVHTTIYIKSNADFNERLATYLGDLGARMFFTEFIKGADELLQIAKDEDHDQKIFGEFISQQIKDLEEWYKKHKEKPDLEKERQAKFAFIISEFEKNIAPKLKTKKYLGFAQAKLNNAKLLGFKLYMNDLSDFEKLNTKLAGNFDRILEYCKSLEKADDPEKTLKDFVGIQN